MATFDEFYRSLDPDSGIRGEQFEKLVKWFLKTDPRWKNQVEDIWLWEEHPQRDDWGPDCGIDLERFKNISRWIQTVHTSNERGTLERYNFDKLNDLPSNNYFKNLIFHE